jgi:hypothetical protein
MVIRDLTLRSASSFGSFHLIRLLFDEYLFYLCEHKIALHANKTPIAVMTQVNIFFLFFSFHFIYSKVSHEDKSDPANISNERRNLPSKISVVVKKDSLSQVFLKEILFKNETICVQGQMMTLSNGTVQLPIFNKLVSSTKLSQCEQNERDNEICDSVKRFKTNE